MIYRGFTLERYAGTTRTGAPLTGWAIRRGDKLFAVAASPELARLHIDDRVRRGIWPDAQPQQMTMDDIMHKEA